MTGPRGLPSPAPDPAEILEAREGALEVPRRAWIAAAVSREAVAVVKNSADLHTLLIVVLCCVGSDSGSTSQPIKRIAEATGRTVDDTWKSINRLQGLDLLVRYTWPDKPIRWRFNPAALLTAKTDADADTGDTDG